MKLGIALSGGGIRGIAHAGVLQALEENGIKPDIIGGTSCGSLIAGLYSIGYSPYHILILAKRYAKTIVKANAIPILSGIESVVFKRKNILSGFNTGEKLEEMGNYIAKRRDIINIKDIKMPIVIPTVDIISGKECVFTNYIPNDKNENKDYIDDITIGKAIRASSSFPAYFSPCRHKDYAFMDGGILNNVPVDDVKRQGADFVISVKFHADDVDENSNIMNVVMKSVDIMGCKISEENLRMSDFVIDVYTDKVGLVDYEKLDKCFKFGYEAGMKCVEKLINCLENKERKS